MRAQPVKLEIDVDLADKFRDEVGAHVRREIDKYLDEHDLRLIRTPIENAMERRAVCLRLAIDTKGVAFSLKNDGSVSESAEQVVIAARIYEEYIGDA